MDPSVAFFLVLMAGGYLLPIPSIGMAAYRYFGHGQGSSKTVWRHALTEFALVAAVVALILWGYAVFRQFHGEYGYTLDSARVGRWSSLVMAALSLPAEGKVRIYLLFFAVGLFLFFGCSIGELP